MTTEEQILEAALSHFSARGFSAVGVQEIVDAVGVTKPTLYHYFGSKRGLFEAVIQQKTNGFLQSFYPVTEWKQDLTFTLQKALKTVLLFAIGEPVFFPYFASLRFAPLDTVEKDCVAPMYQQIDQRLQTLFATSVQAHGNLRSREQLLAATFWSFCVEIAYAVLNEKLPMDDGMIYRSLHQFEHGIYS